MANISLKNIYKVYPGNVTAVSDFNLEIFLQVLIKSIAKSISQRHPTLQGLEFIPRFKGNDLVLAHENNDGIGKGGIV